MLSKYLSWQPHPFRLLLILDWILLGISALLLFGIPGWNQDFYDEITIVEISVLLSAFLLFGLMGLRLPTSGLGKFIYIAIAIFLITIITAPWGNRM